MRVRIVPHLALCFLVLSNLSCSSDPSGGGGGGGGTTMLTLPEIEVSPSSLTFTPRPPGETQELTLTITNTGAGDDLELKDIYIRDEGVPFTFPDPETTTLPEGEKVTIVVTYHAAAENPPDTALMINSNAMTSPILKVPITVAAQTAGLTIYPNPIDFGEVLGASTEVVKVTINNSGSADSTIVNAYLNIDSSDDFQIYDSPDYPVLLRPFDNLVIDVAYTPADGGVDEGTFVVASNEGGGQALSSILVYGVEVGPEIMVAPAKVNFELVEMGESVTQDVTIHNMGEHDLKIYKVYLAPMSNEDLGYENWPEGTVTIKPTNSEVVTATYTPTQYFVATSEPIGGIVVESNDGDEGIINIPVYAQIDAPEIRLDPPEVVDFGIVAQGWTIDRKLTFENEGTSPLIVDLVEITENSPAGEFEMVADDEFPPTMGSGEVTIMPEESKSITLSFTNDGAATGTENGKIHIHSNDPLKTDVYVDLLAKRGGSPECKLAYVPATLEFGTVAHGANKTKTIMLKNAGSGYCSFDFLAVRVCVSWMGLMVMCDPAAGPSPNFKALSMPMPVKNGLAPGTAHPIQIEYTPPTTAPWIPIFEEYTAVLQVTYNEEYSTPGGMTSHKLPEPDQAGQLKWNIHGSSGVADIAVLPPEIEFGLVTIGCYSQTTCVKIYNAGTAPLQVTEIYLEGCGLPSEFQLKEFPELPTDIGESDYKEACVVYLPQNEGQDGCNMVVKSSDLDTPVTYVPLSGEGTWETENTDYFTQISGKKVDILFVVDESASMCGEQDNLADNFNILTAIATQWGNDFQIGITTTNIDAENDEVGQLFGSPPIITKDSVTNFGPNIEDVGCSGSGTQESGLEAGRRAISPPIMDEGGYNAGFVRDDAALEVVFVSDEEDQSPGSVPFYIDFYKSIKGFLNDDMFHAHAIVGDFNGGCNVSQDDGADAGKRYIEVQEATGGVFGSICDDDFSEVLKDIGDKAFGLQVQFFLSAQADAANVKVWVNNVECAAGWNYDVGTNAVIFDENGTCMPQAGDEIKVWYQMICNTE